MQICIGIMCMEHIYTIHLHTAFISFWGTSDFLPRGWRAAQDTTYILTATIGEWVYATPEFACNLPGERIA